VRAAWLLVRRNRNFRLLWMGQIVSQLGDWFSSVALYALLFDLTGSSAAVASLMVAQILPLAMVSPTAGVVVDRVDRRRVMIAADLVRAALVLGLTLVRTESSVWVAYVVTALAVGATGFFEPARSAAMPSIVRREDLVAANALSTGTWSVMLAVGASAGGLVAATLGRDAAFLLNAVSFLLSAVCLWAMRVPARADAPGERGGWHGLVEGLRYLGDEPAVRRIALVKGGWAVVGGALLLLAVFGDTIFRVGGSGDAGIGILYAARGIGAGVGSLAVTTVLHHSESGMLKWIRVSYFAAGASYATLGLAPTIWWAAGTVVVAHAFGSVLWVATNVLLQRAVPDAFRGRVFAAELMALSAVQAVSTYLTAAALDGGIATPRTLAVLIGALLVVNGAAFRPTTIGRQSWAA
jgi:MFS family permease